MSCRLAKSYGFVKLLLMKPATNKNGRLRFLADGFSPAFHSCSTTVNRSMSASSSTNPIAGEEANAVTMLQSVEDKYGGVMTEMNHPMDPFLFSTLLRTSLSNWTLQVLFSFFLSFSYVVRLMIDLVLKIKMRNFYHSIPRKLIEMYGIVVHRIIEKVWGEQIVNVMSPSSLNIIVF